MAGIALKDRVDLISIMLSLKLAAARSNHGLLLNKAHVSKVKS